MFSSENLLKQLDQPRTIDWAPELKSRKDAFAFLAEGVRGNKLNPNQFKNALHMLFRMAFPENANEVLQIFANLTTHQDIEVRSEAVQLAIGLLRTSTNLKTPLLFSDAQETAVRSSFTFRIHGIRGVFINVRPFSTIKLVEPQISDRSGSQHRRDAGGLSSLVPIGSDQSGGFRRWQLRQLNS